MAQVQDVASGLLFPEGPVAMSDGRERHRDARGTISRVGPDGATDLVAETGGGPNGAAVGPDGKLYVCNNGKAFDYVDMGGMMLPVQPPSNFEGGRIERVDIDSGEVDVLYRSARGQAAARPQRHRLRCARRILVHRPRPARGAHERPHRRLLREAGRIGDPGGRASARRPNGLGLSPDAPLRRGDLHRLCWWWPITAPGVVEPPPGLLPHNGQLLARLPGFQFLDSLGVDGDGNVCLATLGSGGITSVSPDDGSVVDFVETGDLLNEHLLRRRGAADRLRHAVGERKAGPGGVAAGGLELAHSA